MLGFEDFLPQNQQCLTRWIADRWKQYLLVFVSLECSFSRSIPLAMVGAVILLVVRYSGFNPADPLKMARNELRRIKAGGSTG